MPFLGRFQLPIPAKSGKMPKNKKRGDYLPPDSDYEYYHMPDLTVFEPEGGLEEPIGFIHFESHRPKPVMVDKEKLLEALDELRGRLAPKRRKRTKIKFKRRAD